MATFQTPLEESAPVRRASDHPIPTALVWLFVRLRLAIQTYIWLDGLSMSIICLATAFWSLLLLDWSFEPPWAIRLLFLIGIGVAILSVIYRLILRRVFVSFSTRNLALIIERRFTQFDDRLLTAVELSGTALPHTTEPMTFNNEMFQITTNEAIDMSNSLSLLQIFNMPRLLRRITLALIFTVSIVLFSIFANESFSFYLARLSGSNELWPRQTKLIVDGFEKNEQGVRTVKIGRGAPLKIVVKAYLSYENKSKIVPETVKINYQTDSQERGSPIMTQLGRATRGIDTFQHFTYEFKSVTQSMTLNIRGGDDRIEHLRVEVKNTPSLVETKIHCIYPRYMMDELTGRYTPRDLMVTGKIRIPKGSKITLKLAADKALTAVTIEESGEQNPIRLQLPLGRSDPNQFNFPLGILNQSKTLLITLTDDNGISNREPQRIEINMITDEKPNVSIRFSGIGDAVTPDARLPLSGTISDDYALANGSFLLQVTGEKPYTRPLKTPLENKLKVIYRTPKKSSSDKQNTDSKKDKTESIEEYFDFHDLVQDRKAPNITAGKKLILQLIVTDGYDLADQPNQAASERFHFDVVTAEELLQRLGSHELMLRQRFEIMIDELQQTRDLIITSQLQAIPPKQKPMANNLQPPSQVLQPKKLRRNPITLIHRILQNSDRSAEETLGMMKDFMLIRQQLINNRVDAKKRMSRLQDDIILKLEKIHRVQYTKLLELLDTLKQQVVAESRWKTNQDQAVKIEEQIKQLTALTSISNEQQKKLNQLRQKQTKLKELLPQLKSQISGKRSTQQMVTDVQVQTDLVISKLSEVLHKMLELEDFNELVEILRWLNEKQGGVNQKTIKKWLEMKKKSLLD